MTYQPPLNGKRISIKADDNPAIESGEVTLASGSNVTLDQSGNTITFDSSSPPVLVLGEDDPIPEGTSPDTIIVRLGESVGGGGGGEGGSGGGDIEAVGTVKMYAGSTAPDGWHLCDGSAVSRETYADLFAVIGTTYGEGDGSTTFNLPNLKGRFPVGRDSGQSEFNTLGETGGEKEHQLTVGEMPSHTHIQDPHTHLQNSHNHTQNSHTHTGPSHTHSIPDHTHTFSTTTNTDGTHGHTTDRANGATGAGAGGPVFGFRFDGSNNAGGMTTAVSSGAHSHSVSGTTDSGGSGNTGSGGTGNTGSTTATNQETTATNQETTATNQETGGDEPHNNLPPYITVNFIIKMVPEPVMENAFIPQFLRAEQRTDQTTDLSNGDHIKFDTVQASSGSYISLDTSSEYTSGAGDSIGRFTLAAGKTYLLRGVITAAGFDSTGGYICYQWANVSDDELVGSGAVIASQQYGESYSGYGGYAEAVVTPETNMVVELRMFDVNDATYISENASGDGQASAYIQVIESVVGGGGGGGEGGGGGGGEGGLSAIFNVSTKTSNYTITTDDTMILADATSNNVTITLPLASEAEGYRFYIKRVDDSANTVTIARSGSDTIDGGTSASINGQWTVVGAVSDGNAWYLI